MFKSVDSLVEHAPATMKTELILLAVLVATVQWVNCEDTADCVEKFPVKLYSMDDADVHFGHFERTYNKKYHSEDERNHRFETFKKNLMKINSRKEKFPHLAHKYNINEFSDMSHDDFNKLSTRK